MPVREYTNFYHRHLLLKQTVLKFKIKVLVLVLVLKSKVLKFKNQTSSLKFIVLIIRHKISGIRYQA